MSIKQKTFTSVRWVAVSMAMKGLIYFLQLAILARFLTPLDFGLIAVLMAIVSFFQIFTDFGLSSAILHHREISIEQLSSLFWVNVLCGAFLAFLILLTSHGVANYYSQPKLTTLLDLSAATLLIGGFGQQLKVLAEKNLNFITLTKIEIASTLAGFVCTVGLVLAGWGVYSMVIGTILTALVFTSLLWVFTSKGWKPIFTLNFLSISPFLKFGSYVILNNLINMINYQADIFIGGKILGAEAIGQYNLSKELSIGISKVVNPIVTRVGTPMMSSLQNKSLKIKIIYLKTLRMTSSVNFPIYIGCFVFARQIIQVFFGAQWSEIVPVFQILSIWGLLRSTSNPVGGLLIAKGRADLSFKWNLTISLIFPPLIFLGSKFGLIGLSISSLLIMILTFLPNWYFLVSPLCGAELHEYLQQFLRPLFASIGAFIVGYIVSLGFSTEIMQLFVGVICATILYLILSYLWNREWIIDMHSLLFSSKKSL